MTLATLYVAGEVHRWHANAAMAREGQTNADHQGRAAQLLLALNPGASAALISAVLHHDVGEAWAGDLPQPFKERAPDLARAHAAIEADMRDAIIGRPFPTLTAEEEDWLLLVDRLEARLFVALRRPAELRRPGSGWPRALVSLRGQAERLGCLPVVDRLLADVIGGAW